MKSVLSIIAELISSIFFFSLGNCFYQLEKNNGLFLSLMKKTLYVVLLLLTRYFVAPPVVIKNTEKKLSFLVIIDTKNLGAYKIDLKHSHYHKRGKKCKENHLHASKILQLQNISHLIFLVFYRPFHRCKYCSIFT